MSKKYRSDAMAAIHELGSELLVHAYAGGDVRWRSSRQDGFLHGDRLPGGEHRAGEPGLEPPCKGGRAAELGGAGGTIAGAIGLVFTLGYLFSPNAPLLYGTESIPMALNTALAFVALGRGIGAGPATFPLLRLCGPSISARLLRAFLPLVVGTVGVVAWLTHVVTSTGGSRRLPSPRPRWPRPRSRLWP